MKRPRCLPRTCNVMTCGFLKICVVMNFAALLTCHVCLQFFYFFLNNVKNRSIRKHLCWKCKIGPPSEQVATARQPCEPSWCESWLSSVGRGNDVTWHGIEINSCWVQLWGFHFLPFNQTDQKINICWNNGKSFFYLNVSFRLNSKLPSGKLT